MKNPFKQSSLNHQFPVKVSVIIPVYNAESYIRRCLDSLVNQTLKECEFIFVDDCGQDDSMKIVEEYQQNDSRIKILHNESNTGPGPSRNKGIEAAKGEYLAFVDPDDWVSPNAYKKLYKKAIKTHADVVKGNVQVTDENGNDITKDKNHFNNSEIKQRLSKGIPLYVALKSAHWSMIFSRKLLEDPSIRYGTTRSAQDGLFLLRVFLTTSDISFCNHVVYHYCRRDNGLSTMDHFDRHLAFVESLRARIETLNERASFDTYYFKYITDYSTFLLKEFKSAIEGKENEKQAELEEYLNRFEEAINQSKDAAQVYDALPVYKELNRSKVDGGINHKKHTSVNVNRLSSKNDYLELAKQIVDPVLRYCDESTSVIAPPHSFAINRLKQEDVYFEFFARPLWAVTYLVKEGDKELGKRILRMIANGTDPQSPSYWGDLTDYGHKLVDQPAICLFLYENIDLVQEYYSEEEKNTVVNWLLSANKVNVWENNWLFFSILNNAFLLNAGLGGDRKVMEKNWRLLDGLYLDNGWYHDGKRRQNDYYVAFGFHFYSLLWASVDKDIPTEIHNTIRERAETFARSFLLFFDDNGEAVPLGRSLIYRFAQVSFWSAYVKAGLTGIPTSTVKGLINRHLRWWLSHDIFDENGLLTIGYAYANTRISEFYCGSGSPYWACKTFVLLGLDDNAEFWNAPEDKYPETKDESLCVKHAGLLISKHNGIVNLFPINQNVPFRIINKESKYEKIVYSTRTGFCFSDEKGSRLSEIGIDGTFAISENGEEWMIRKDARSKYLSDSTIHSAWSADEETSIDTYVAIHQGWHIRVHRINSEKEFLFADGGFAAPGHSSKANVEEKRITINGEDFYSETLCMTNGTAKLCQPERGLNSLDPDCAIPYVLSRVNPGENTIINSFYIGSNPPDALPLIKIETDRIIVDYNAGNRQEIPLNEWKDVKVSVIVPVYNVEKYIRRCLDSLVNQTLKDLEFIFVDDCSQDNSMKIVEEYQRRDPRIIILRNSFNCGEGVTKNRGIEIAQGEYLSFVDSDDYVAPDFYELLYNAATKNRTHNIAKGIGKPVDDKGNKTAPVDYTVNQNIVSSLRKKKPIYRVFSREHTTAIYHRRLFKDLRNRFGTSHSAGDTTFLLRCCYHTNDIVLEEAAVYFYVQREQSIPHGNVLKRMYGELDALEEKAEFLKEKGLNENAIDYLLDKANIRFDRLSKSYHEGLISDQDYAILYERYVDILNNIPNAKKACRKYPALKNLSFENTGKPETRKTME